MMEAPQKIKTADLVQGCRQGDMEALRLLYSDTYPRLLETARRYVDYDTAYDVVHDSFLIAFTSLDSLHDDSKFEAWLTRIVRNVSLNHIKHEKVIQTLPLESVQDTVTDEIPDEPPVPLNVLLGMVSRLPNGYGQVFRLRTLTGLSHEQISRRLGISSSTSRSQYTHARRMLKDMVRHWWMAPVSLALAVMIYLGLILFGNKQVSNTQPTPKTANSQQTATPPPDNETTTDTGNWYRDRGQSPLAASETVAKDTAATVLAADNITNNDDQNLPADTTKRSVQPSPGATIQKNPSLAIEDVKPQNPVDWRNLRQDNSRMSFAMAVSGFPDKVNQLRATTVTGISSLAPIDSQTDSPQPTEFDNWTDYHRFIDEEALINPTEETLSLQRIAQSNAMGNPRQDIEERVRHDMPLTVSLSLNKTITGKWSLGTGLNYTRLHSTADIGYSAAYVRNEQTIHYLGIPFNASYKFYGNGRWRLYGVAGATLDIPVSNTWSTKHVLNGQTIYTRGDKLSLPVQWSVNAGLGVQYNLSQRIGIFAQPGINYYFDNGTKTIRSAHPWSVSLPIGLRFTW